MTALKALLTATCLVALSGCTSLWQAKPDRISRTTIDLSTANFRTTLPHVVGRAKSHHVFWFRVGGPEQLSGAAWGEMKRNAAIDGQPAQYVNVTEERTTRWSFLPIYWQEAVTVSADVVAFDEG